VTAFYLIRHAQRTGDQERLVGRLAGFGLTALGTQQAERLARTLAREPISHIYSSPMERARETAAPLARQLGLVVELSAAITEVDAGSWTGRSFRELDAEDPQWRRFNRLRVTSAIPNGETAAGIQARFLGEMMRLQELHPTDGVALVSHADPIKIVLAAFLGAPIDFHDRLQIDLASVSLVRMDAESARVVYLNRTSENGQAV
jgi:broad specificity phosphatase PhoE